MRTYQSIIERLNLLPHPEGGYYRRQWQSAQEAEVTDDNGKVLHPRRSIGSGIIYLLPSHEVSAWHRLSCDEMWHLYLGSKLNLYILDNKLGLRHHCLGTDLERGELPQFSIPKGSWFCAEVADEDSFSLCGCTLWPSFSYADFELADPDELIKAYPAHEDLILRIKAKQNIM